MLNVSSATSNWGKRHLAGLALGVLGIIGAMLPWGRIAFLTVNGTDGDGVITLILSLAFMAAVALNGMGSIKLGWTALACALLGGAIAGIGIDHWADLESLDTRVTDRISISVRVGTGLILTAVVGVTMIAYAAFLSIRLIQAKRQVD